MAPSKSLFPLLFLDRSASRTLKKERRSEENTLEDVRRSNLENRRTGDNVHVLDPLARLTSGDQFSLVCFLSPYVIEDVWCSRGGVGVSGQGGGAAHDVVR